MKIDIEAYMKLYITWNGSHFFIAKLYLKQSVSSGYDMVDVDVDFICMGLPDLWWEQTENYKMKISCL